MYYAENLLVVVARMEIWRFIDDHLDTFFDQTIDARVKEVRVSFIYLAVVA